MRPSIERYFSSAKHSRLLNQHQCLGQERVSLHGRMATLSYLLTAWGRLAASDYEHMRHMRIRLPRATRAVAASEPQECAGCCICPKHGGQEDQPQPPEPGLDSGKPSRHTPTGI